MKEYVCYLGIGIKQLLQLSIFFRLNLVSKAAFTILFGSKFSRKCVDRCWVSLVLGVLTKGPSINYVVTAGEGGGGYSKRTFSK